jgi:hypothetical protein
MGEHDDLLRRHQPGVKYDSMEQYFADSAEQWLVNPGNELRRADTGNARGEVLATGAQLTLAFLAAEKYGSGAEVRDTDLIGDPHRNYREQYVALRQARPDLKNRMYGHAVEEGGRLWLQYWLYYFYNDYNLALGIGLHEGDWEMVQLRMHDDEPDLAAARTRRTSMPASTRPRRGTTSPTASATRRAWPSRSSMTTRRRGLAGPEFGGTPAPGSAASTNPARAVRPPTARGITPTRCWRPHGSPSARTRSPPRR